MPVAELYVRGEQPGHVLGVPTGWWAVHGRATPLRANASRNNDRAVTLLGAA